MTANLRSLRNVIPIGQLVIVYYWDNDKDTYIDVFRGGWGQDTWVPVLTKYGDCELSNIYASGNNDLYIEIKED